MRKLLLTTLLLICSLVSIAHAEVSPEKRKEIEKMLRLTGMEKLMTQMQNQMIAALQEKLPDAPGDFWNKFKQQADVHELLERIIPVYDKYYTTEDLKAVNAFYESPAGKKVLATLPQVAQDCMKIGQEWGEEVGKKAAAEAAQESKDKRRSH